MREKDPFTLSGIQLRADMPKQIQKYKIYKAVEKWNANFLSCCNLCWFHWRIVSFFFLTLFSCCSWLHKFTIIDYHIFWSDSFSLFALFKFSLNMDFRSQYFLSPFFLTFVFSISFVFTEVHLSFYLLIGS